MASLGEEAFHPVHHHVTQAVERTQLQQLLKPRPEVGIVVGFVHPQQVRCFGWSCADLPQTACAAAS